jgi:ribosome-binding factor A
MDLKRRQKMESFVLEELALLLRKELKDPRVPSITLTKAELTSDGSYATLYYMILGMSDEDTPENKERLRSCQEGLKSAAPFLKSQLKKSLQTKIIPEIIFKPDLGFKNTLIVNELLKKIQS